MSDNIQVAIKSRPLIDREIKQNLKPQWSIQNRLIFPIDESAQRIGEPYSFDHVFDETRSNEDVYKGVVQFLVNSCLQGFNATIFAYGQTSSGKTHIMMGSKRTPGIIQLAVNDIFTNIAQNQSRQFLVRCSFFELYNENINDLLDNSKSHLQIRENYEGNIRVDAREFVVTSATAVFEIMTQGNKNRKIGCTNMNKRSSRSHTIFRINIESKQADIIDGPVQMSQLNLVDLAGSERVAQSKAAGMQLKEGVNINKSLSVLSNVIRQLSENEGFINYRDSKLTRILQSALGGNSKSLIITTITLAVAEETKSTLEFAQRAKVVKNKPTVNEILSHDDKIKKYVALTQDYCSRLKRAEDQIKRMEIEKSQWLLEIEQIKSDACAIKDFNLGSTEIAPIKQLVKRRHTVGYSSSFADFFVEEATTPLQSGKTDKRSLRTIYEESASELAFLEHTAKSEDTQIAENMETPPEQLKARLEALERSYTTLSEFTSFESQLSDSDKDLVQRLMDDKFKLLQDVQNLTKLLKSEQKEKQELKYKCEQLNLEKAALRATVDMKNQDAASAMDLLSERTKHYEIKILYLKEELDRVLYQREQIMEENKLLLAELDIYKQGNKQILENGVKNVELDNKCHSLTEQLTCANEQINKYEKIITEYDEQIFELHEQMAALEKQIIDVPEISDIKNKLLTVQNHLSQVLQMQDVEIQTEYNFCQAISVQTEFINSVDVSIQTDTDIYEKQILSLRNQINVSLTEIDSSQAQVADLIQEKDELKSLFDKVAVEYLHESRMLEDLQEQYDQLENENIELLRDLKSAVKQMEETVQQHLKDKEKVYAELEDVKCDNKSLLFKMKEITRDIKRLKADNFSWRNHKEEMLEEQELMANNLQQKESEIEHLQQELKEYKEAEPVLKDLKDVQNQSRILIPELQKAIEDEFQQLQTEIEELKTQSIDYKEYLAKSRTEIENMQTLIIELKGKCSLKEQLKSEKIISELRKCKDNEIEQLQAQIKEFQEKCSDYEEKQNKSKNKICELSQQFESETKKVQTEFQQLKKECSDYQEHLVKSKNEIVELRAKCSAYEEKQTKYQNTISELRKSNYSEIELLQTEIKELKQKCFDYKENQSMSKSIIAELNQRIENDEKVQAELTELRKDYKENLIKYKNETEKLEGEITELRGKCSEYEEKQVNSEISISKLRKDKDSKIELLQAQIEDFKKKCSDYKEMITEFNQLQGEITELRGKCSYYEEKQIESVSAISQLRTSKDSKIEQLQAQIEQLKKTCSHYEENQIKSDRVISEMNRCVVESDIEKVQAEIRQLRQECSDHQELLMKHKIQTEQLESEVKKLKEKCSVYEENENTSKLTISKLKRQQIEFANELKLKVTENQHLQKEKKKLVATLQAEIHVLKLETKSLSTKNLTLDDKVKSKVNEIDQLREENKNLQDKLRVYEEEIKTLHNEIKQNFVKMKDPAVTSVKSISASNSAASSPQLSPKSVARKQIMYDLIDQRRSIGSECTKEDADILQEDLEQSYKALNEKDCALNVLKRQLLDLKSQIDALEEENKVLNMEVEHYMGLSEDLKTQLVQKEEYCTKKINGLHQQLEKQASVIARRDNTVTQLMMQMTNLRKDYQEKKMLIKTYEGIKNDLSLKLHNAEKVLSKPAETTGCCQCLVLQKNIDDLTALNWEKNKHIVEHQTKVFELLNTAKDSEEKEKMLKARITSLESFCQAQNQKKKAAEVQCDLENEELKALKNKYAYAKKIAELRRREILKLKDKLGVHADIEVD